jgi:hypothetical protein
MLMMSESQVAYPSAVEVSSLNGLPARATLKVKARITITIKELNNVRFMQDPPIEAFSLCS